MFCVNSLHTMTGYIWAVDINNQAVTYFMLQVQLTYIELIYVTVVALVTLYSDTGYTSGTGDTKLWETFCYSATWILFIWETLAGIFTEYFSYYSESTSSYYIFFFYYDYDYYFILWKQSN